jgi:predicted ArsR family transcriptional regulator
MGFVENIWKKFVGKKVDIHNMEGLTMTEMAEILGIDENTVKQRLFRAGIKPLTTKAVYPSSALDAIREAPMGRPPKSLESDKEA